MGADLFNGPQLLFLATTIVLAHLWHRRRFTTARIACVYDGTSESPPLDADVVRADLSDE